MAVIRWNPWNISSLLNDDFDVPTIPGISRLGQGLNLYDTETSVVAQAALPGVPEDKIDVSIDERIVRITGASTENEEEKSNRRYFMNSVATSYNYTFKLPEGVDEKVEPVAELENGVLKLTFSKLAKVPPKKVKVVKKSK